MDDDEVVDYDDKKVKRNFPELKVKCKQLFFSTIKGCNSVNFKRATATYTHLRSPFLCPVWDATNVKDTLIYVSPYLTPLREILKREHKDYRFLHTVFFPIAMAIDTLHTVVPGRSYFFHRDVCLDKVVIPECTGKRKKADNNDVTAQYEGQDDVIYGNARLKLSDLTKPIIALESAENSGSFKESSEKYYHHSSAKGVNYVKEHDWYSYGIFIIEVFFEMFKTLTTASRFEKYGNFCERSYDSKYNDILEDMKKICQENKDTKFGGIHAKFIQRYLDVAEMCIIAASTNLEIKCTKESMKQIDSEEPIFFEYEISEVAAQLFELYQRYEEANVKKYHLLKLNKGICQSCLINDTVKIPTRIFRCDSIDRRKNCTQEDEGKLCAYYCKECYRNREKKFCPVHGTVSKLLGHTFSHALLFFGEEYQDPLNLDRFEKDARKLANALMDLRVHGMSEENVIIKGLNGPDPNQLFEEAVKAMRQKIHNHDDQGNCKNAHKYQLFIYYSGHGGESQTELGTWRPNVPTKIARDKIQTELNKIRGCSACQDRNCCELVIWLMDHCFPESPTGNQFLAPQKSEMPDYFIIQVYTNEKAFYDTKGSGLTGLLHKVISGNFQKKSKDATSSSKQPELITAEKILEEYKEDKTKPEERKFMTSSSIQLSNYILAYRNDEKVEYAIHELFNCGNLCVFADFNESFTLASVEQKIKKLQKLKARDTVLLLTNLTRNCTLHTFIWEHELQYILERRQLEDCCNFYPALAYYQVIAEKDKLKVELKGKGLSTDILLPVSKHLIDRLSGMGSIRPRKDSLPNILEFVVYQIYRIQQKAESKPKSRQAESGIQPDVLTDCNKLEVFESFIRKIDYRCLKLPHISEHKKWKYLGVAADNKTLKVELNANSKDLNPPDDGFIFRMQNKRYCLDWNDDLLSVNSTMQNLQMEKS